MDAGAGAGTYWRISSFYFLYFTVLGVMVPYWSLYLASIGLSGAAIGTVIASGSAVRVVSPFLWARLGDRSGRRLLIIRVGAIAAAISFAGLLVRQEFAWVLATVAIHTFFWNAILSQYEVIALASLAGRFERYGKVRLWGSVSFVIAVIASGYLFDHLPVRQLPQVLLVVLAAVAIGSFAVPDARPRQPQRHPGGVRALLLDRVFVAFIVAGFLLQMSHGPYYTYFSLHLDGLGFSRTLIGQLWSIGVIAEVAVFGLSHRLLTRFTLRQVLIASTLLGVLRWLVTAASGGSIVALAFAQSLHAATYGSFHAAGVELVRRHFGGAYQGQGQAVYGALSFGAGGTIGAFLSGYLWEWNALAGFVLAALVAALGGCVFHLAVRGPLVEHPGSGARGQGAETGR